MRDFDAILIWTIGVHWGFATRALGIRALTAGSCGKNTRSLSRALVVLNSLSLVRLIRVGSHCQSSKLLICALDWHWLICCARNSKWMSYVVSFSVATGSWQWWEVQLHLSTDKSKSLSCFFDSESTNASKFGPCSCNLRQRLSLSMFLMHLVKAWPSFYLLFDELMEFHFVQFQLQSMSLWNVCHSLQLLYANACSGWLFKHHRRLVK